MCIRDSPARCSKTGLKREFICRNNINGELLDKALAHHAGHRCPRPSCTNPGRRGLLGCVYLGLVASLTELLERMFLGTSREICSRRYLRNGLFSVEWDVRPQRNRSVDRSTRAHVTTRGITGAFVVVVSGARRHAHSQTDSHTHTRARPIPRHFSPADPAHHQHHAAARPPPLNIDDL